MRLLLLPLFFFCTALLPAQEKTNLLLPKKEKGSFYFSWGYNKDWFSKSDLHFSDVGHPDPANGKNNSYDFVVYDVKAKDRPGFRDIMHTDITIPQYVYRIGYYFNKAHDLGIEINFDHAKYVMQDNQVLHVKGTIHGQTIDKDTLVTNEDFLHLEHTDGANFMMLNIMKRQRFAGTPNNLHVLRGIIKVGAGIVIPKTYVKLWGEEMDNRFHIAGYCMGAEAGLRYEAYKYIFVEYTGKGVFANYNKVLTMGSGKAHHHFWTFENILCLGLQFPL